jgi:anti-sigma B factor antagonist/stage II sporulation protein AA (anti-sigma F factor antagonist)
LRRTEHEELDVAVDDQYRIERSDGHVTVFLVGEIDMDTKVPVQDALAAALTPPLSRVDVDLSQVTFLDSSGIASLVAAWRNARDQGVAFALQGSAGEVERVLAITGIRESFEQEP